MRIYLDNCALGRLTDDQTQQRIREEADAVQQVFRSIEAGMHEWVISPALQDEAEQNHRYPERRQDALDLLRRATIIQPLTSEVAVTAAGYQQDGLGLYDALHLAAALAASCGVLLTTDDRFLRPRHASTVCRPGSSAIRSTCDHGVSDPASNPRCARLARRALPN